MSQETYLVTARKYRPLLFKDVVGQEHVTETLKNAIRLDRLAHAYLFSGPRGVGKTTAARILAKAVNCTTALEEREDSAEPCRTCDSCRSLEQGRNMNIIEIDAASNNKVDDARDLRDTVRIPPQGSRMKVYIVDEVHMLSNAAFNALLKTLEEPPPHALFIFATTEPHKVLATIQSRCQRFDFRRIAVSETIDRLTEIGKSENIRMDEESLMLLARKGDGALRDALSVFDQAVSLCGTDITHAELTKALGVVDADLYFECSEAVRQRDTAGMIHLVDRIVRSGYDLQEFVDGLAEHLRNLLVARTSDEPSLIEATPALRKRIAGHAAHFSESTLLNLIHIAGDAAELLRNSRQPRLRLEMALLRMASLPDAVDIRSALEKLDRLERMAASGEVKLVTEVRASATPPDPRPASEPGPQPSPEPAPQPRLQTEPTPTPQPKPSPEPVPQPERRRGPAPGPSSPDPAAPGPSSAGPTTPAPTEPSRTEVPSDPSLFLGTPALKKKNIQASVPLPSEDEDVLVAEEESDGDELQAPKLEAAWNQVVVDVMESEKQLGSFLRHTRVSGMSGNTVHISVPDEFHARALRSDCTRLMHRLADLSGQHLDRMQFDITQPSGDEADDRDEIEDARNQLQQYCEESPAVKSLVERFGGEIVW